MNGQSILTRDPEQHSKPGRLWPGNYFELKVIENQQVPEKPLPLPERNAVLSPARTICGLFKRQGKLLITEHLLFVCPALTFLLSEAPGAFLTLSSEGHTSLMSCLSFLCSCTD